jgi:hypothetical protein
MIFAAIDAAIALLAIAGWACAWGIYYCQRARAEFGQVSTTARTVLLEHLLFTGAQATIAGVSLFALSFVVPTVAAIMLLIVTIIPMTCPVTRRWARRTAVRFS